MVDGERIADGRKTSTSFIIIDAQSVKNADTARLKGYDAGKKVSGIKRHIAVDTQGLPHALHVTAANVSDKAGALVMLAESKAALTGVSNVLVDGGYMGGPFREKVKALISAEVEVVKRSELHTFAVMPKRWVVERTFSWLDKCHRLWKNCERLTSSILGMVRLALIRLLLKRF